MRSRFPEKQSFLNKKETKKPSLKEKAGKVHPVPDSFYKTLFDNAGIGILFLDCERKIIRANAYFQKLVNYSESELKNLEAKNLVHPEDFPEDEKLFNEVILGKSTGYIIEKRFITKDRNIVHVRFTISYIHNSRQKKKIIIAIVEDYKQTKTI